MRSLRTYATRFIFFSSHDEKENLVRLFNEQPFNSKILNSEKTFTEKLDFVHFSLLIKKDKAELNGDMPYQNILKTLNKSRKKFQQKNKRF